MPKIKAQLSIFKIKGCLTVIWVVFWKFIFGYFRSPKIARNSGIVSFLNFKVFMYWRCQLIGQSATPPKLWFFEKNTQNTLQAYIFRYGKNPFNNMNNFIVTCLIMSVIILTKNSQNFCSFLVILAQGQFLFVFFRLK